MLPMRDDDDEQVKIELLSQWKLEAESRNTIICSELASLFPIQSSVLNKVIQLRLDATPLLLPFIPTVFGENFPLLRLRRWYTSPQ